MKTKHLLLGGALALLASISGAQTAPADVETRLRLAYPNTKFVSVKATPLSGIYEVVMGSNVAFTDEQGRYFMFGNLFDMKEQVDLTPQRPRAERRVEFPSAALGNAIKTVKGDGSRVFAVFSDPDCPYCQKLEKEITRLNNATIYTFLMPLESLHPEAKAKAISVWCAPDRAAAWETLMLTGAQPALKACANPVIDNLELATKLGFTGTPTLVAADGRVLQGAVPFERLDTWLTPAAEKVAQ